MTQLAGLCHALTIVPLKTRQAGAFACLWGDRLETLKELIADQPAPKK